MENLIEEMRKCFDYVGDNKTLPFIRVVARGGNNRYAIGTRVGCNKRSDRYACLRIGGGSGTLILMHRAVWMWHNGIIPEGMQIDHINCDRSDNRIENLRCVDGAINTQNQQSPAPTNKHSRVLGVYFRHDCPKRPWFARVIARGKAIKSKQFATIEEAEKERERLAVIFQEGHIVKP